ncbi:serine/threonine-protein kinase [Actinomadura sp. NPDC048394]|uniref:WD40 repeat domain-containing serine/threonine protein kinase n=1 Tax=Actinomadura sp. NPDC048394 TaxID=3158223 RepID=UPI0033D6D9FE
MILPWRVGDVVAGRYAVLGVNEHGGMGLVYRVRHLSWGTDLAVKRPRPEMFSDASGRKRFVAEAETWVSLGLHPNVCGCHYVRTLDGVPCVFAEYVAGGSLQERIDDRALYEGDAAARILDLAIQMAWGLRHAHERGVVHQDIKPANVLLDGDGTAKVTDFGLARAVTSAAPGGDGDPVTNAGMTVRYASPEQLQGEPLDRRTDVYSFAVSVLEMFNGGATWRVGAAAGEALAALRVEGPAEPGPPALPPALADLLERCLRAEPAARPASMAEVADELDAVYRQVTGHAHPRPAPAEAELRADELNNRALSLLDLDRPAASGEAFAQALLADPRHLQATYNAGLLRWRRGAATDEDLVTAVEVAGRESGDSWEARYLLAQVHMERGDLPAARELLAAAERERPGEPQVAAALRAIDTGRTAGAARTGTRALPGHADPLRRLLQAVAFTPDGRLALVGGTDGVLRLWDLAGGTERSSLEAHRGQVDSVAVSADARFAVSVGLDAVMRYWDLESGRCLWTAATGQAARELGVTSVRLSADGRVAVAAVRDGRVLVWDPPARTPRLTIGGHGPDVAVEVSADGRRVLATARERYTVQLWDVGAGRCRVVLDGDLAAAVTAMGMSADGRTAVIATADRRIGVWSLDDGRHVRTLAGSSGFVAALSLSADGRRLLSGGEDGAVRLWDVAEGRCLRTFDGHGDEEVLGVLMDPGGRSGISLGQDRTARTWTWPPKAEPVAALQPSRPRRHAELSRLAADAGRLVDEAERALSAGRLHEARELLTRARAVPGHERAPRVLDAWWALSRRIGLARPRGGWTARVLPEPGARIVRSAGLSRDGRIAACGSSIGTVHVWDLHRGTLLHEIETSAPADVVAVSADGERVLSASGTGAVGLWSAATGERLAGLDRRATGGATSAALSADGRSAITCSHNYAVRVWDLDEARCVRTLAGHRARIDAAWLHGDGRLAASASNDGTIRLWDLDAGACVRTIEHGHGHWVKSVCLGADARTILSSGYGERPIRSWDAGTGALIRAFDERPGNATAVRFTAGGRFAVSGGEDSGVRLWDAATGRCVRTLDGHRDRVGALAVTPDGRYALSGSDDGTTRLWELDWDLAPHADQRGDDPERGEPR